MLPEEFQKIRNQEAAVFGLNQGDTVNTFLSLRTEQGDLLIMQAHESARDAMKKICSHLKIGVTLSLYDICRQSLVERKLLTRMGRAIYPLSSVYAKR